MELLQKAQTQLNYLKNLEQEIQEQLKNTSNETLRLSKSNGTFQYYSETKKKRTYIRKKNIQFAKALAQRDYNRKLIPYIMKNIDALEEFSKKYSPQKCEKCFSKLPLARRLLIKPFFVDDITYAKQWQAQKYEAKKEIPQGNFSTPKNENVRSKSEVIIANMLNAKGIPYHYEYPVKIKNNLTIYPDFLCLNIRTRQQYFWEHCGRMDDSEYSENLVNRLSWLAQKNIFVGKNLILTMETKDAPLNMKFVERMIDLFLK